MAGLGFERVEAEILPILPGLTRHARFAEPKAFLGKLGDTQVHIRLRKGAALELRVRFTPRVSSRRAFRLFSKLGVSELAGTWK